MDRFEKVITKEKLSLLKRNPLPNHPAYYDFEMSFDNIDIFINLYANKLNSSILLNVTIHDEIILDNPLEICKRYKVLKILNQLNLLNINFNLSDSTLPIYNMIMDKISWKHEEKTKLYMRIDRNPIYIPGRDLKLDLAKGKIMLPEEKLIWIPDYILTKLNGKVDKKVLEDTDKLKDIVFKYCNYIDNKYNFKYFTDFDKVMFTYDFIKRNIKFAKEATRTIDNREVLYNTGNLNWVSEPLGTIEHKRGVCEGQARLMCVLLNNYFMGVDAVTINGTCKLGNHAWVGTVINGKLYEICLTMAGAFKNLQQKGYEANQNEIYPLIYPLEDLNDVELSRIKMHIKSLEK